MGVFAGIEPTWAAQTDVGRTHIATKGIVQSGLVLNLDAGVSSSYPGSGTTWTDLSGRGNNGTLTNGPTYSSSNGGIIVFDGVNDYVQCSGSTVTSAATFIVWINRNGTQSNNAGIFFSRGTSVTGINFYGTTNKLAYHWNNASNTYSWDSGLTIPNLSWCMCAVSVSGTSATAYLCQSSGISSSTNTVSHSSTTIDDLKIGQDDEGLRWMKSSISNVSFYNKSLTAAEVQQNFNALRGRYGI